MLANATFLHLALQISGDSHVHYRYELMRLSFLHRKTRRSSNMLSGEPNVYRCTGYLRERI